jgi:hypothetical protein
MHKEYCYCIYKKDYESKAEVILVHELPATGFMSTYLYKKEALEFYDKKNSIKGLGKKKFKCYSPVIYFDFDDEPEAALALEAKLVSNRVKFNTYNSGGRSVHFHVARNSEPSYDLPASDKKFVSDLAPKADDCLYQHGRVFRLAGTLHHATGDPKILLNSYDGSSVNIDIIEVPRARNTTVSHEYGILFEDQFVMGCMMGASTGGRNKMLFMLLKNLVDRQLPRDFIETFVKEANKVNRPPLADEEIESMLMHHI